VTLEAPAEIAAVVCELLASGEDNSG